MDSRKLSLLVQAWRKRKGEEDTDIGDYAMWQCADELEAALNEIRVDGFCEYSTAVPAPICPAALADTGTLTDDMIEAESVRRREPISFEAGAQWARDRMR